MYINLFIIIYITLDLSPTRILGAEGTGLGPDIHSPCMLLVGLPRLDRIETMDMWLVLFIQIPKLELEYIQT